MDAEPNTEYQIHFVKQNIKKKSMAPHTLVNVFLHPQVTICSAGVIMNCLE